MRQAACRTVSATLKTGESRHDGATQTLGKLLHSDKAGRAPEAEWLALVESAAAGDQSALRALYDRTHRIVFTLIMRIVGNRQSTEELTVDVYHEVWRRASKYDAAAGSVVGWIMNLARSRAIDRVRFDHRKKRFSPDPGAPSEALGDSDCDVVELEQRGQAVREALGVLTAAERQVIEAAFFSEQTYAEVAKLLDQPPGTVKTRIRAGLAKLRTALASTGEGREFR